MKNRIILSLIVAFLISMPAYADTWFAPVTATNSSAIVVGANGTVYTATIATKEDNAYTLSYKTSSPTTGVASANTIVMQQSYQLPTTAETNDSTYTTPSTQSTGVTTTVFSGTTSGTWYHQDLKLTALPYMRFKITSSSQGTDNQVEMYLTRRR